MKSSGAVVHIPFDKNQAVLEMLHQNHTTLRTHVIDSMHN